ncbi:MAG: dTMP kinase [Gemmatimonadetes bacterium]|nr:dTMP kinase [Gemmatimonadota bacterium]
MTRGHFIVLEGGEGAGKSTQAALLSASLAAAGVRRRVTREPGGAPVGEAIRSVVLGRTDLEMPPESELLLFLAARAAVVRDVVRPALQAGEVVVADRFALSTLAYQGYGRGLDLAEVRHAVARATGGLEPDLYVILDVPVSLGAERQRHGGKRPDRIEGEGDAFLRRVRDGYLALAEHEPHVRVVPGEGSPEEIHARIRRLLMSELPGLFPASPGRTPGS